MRALKIMTVITLPTSSAWGDVVEWGVFDAATDRMILHVMKFEKAITFTVREDDVIIHIEGDVIPHRQLRAQETALFEAPNGLELYVEVRKKSEAAMILLSEN